MSTRLSRATSRRALGLIIVAICACSSCNEAPEPAVTRQQQDAAEYGQAVASLEARSRKQIKITDSGDRIKSSSGDRMKSRNQFNTAKFAISDLKYPPIKSLVASLRSDDIVSRLVAIQSARYIGTAAVDAVPVLISITEQEVGNTAADSLESFLTIREIATAHRTLGEIGWERSDEVLPVLMKGLKNEHREVREAAWIGLFSLGPLAKEEIPVICDYAVKYHSNHALRLLPVIAPESPLVLEALLEALSDEGWQRSTAIEKLGRVGQFAAPVVVPRLVEVVRNGERFEGESALKALGEIGPAAEEAVPVLIEYLDEFPTTVTYALAKIGRRADLVVPRLMQALSNSPNPDEVIYALGEFGAQANEAVPLLISKYEKISARESDSSDWYDTVLKIGCIRALGKIAVPKDRIRALFLKAIRQDLNHGARAAAAKELGNLDPPNEKVLAALNNALKDNDPRLRVSAAAALVKQNHGGDNPAHVLAKALDEYLSDSTTPSNEIGRRIDDTIERMGELGPKIRPAMPILMRAAEDENTSVRAAAIHSATSVGGNAPEVIDLLEKALADRDPYVRLNAAVASAEIGIASGDVLSILSRELRDNDFDSSEAAEALGQLGAKAQSALPVLKRCRNAPLQRVRNAAQKAIQQIEAAVKSD